MKLDQMVDEFEGNLFEAAQGAVTESDLGLNQQYAAVLYGELSKHFGTLLDPEVFSASGRRDAQEWLLANVGSLIEQYRIEQAAIAPVLKMPLGPVTEKP